MVLNKGLYQPVMGWKVSARQKSFQRTLALLQSRSARILTAYTSEAKPKFEEKSNDQPVSRVYSGFLS